MKRGASCLLAALMLGGCIEDLPTGVRVDRPRVLGVRVSIDGEPERAQPRPGETITLHWLTVPGGGEWTGVLTACVAQPSNTGLPRCAGEPFAVATSGPPGAAPAFTSTMPARATGEVLVTGVLCEGGVPALPDEGLPECEGDGAETELVTFSFPLATEQPPNRHPSWADETLSLDGEVWEAPPEALPDTGCASMAGDRGLPRVARRGEEEPSTIRFTSSPDDREAYRELVYGDPPSFEDTREELLVTHVTTAGLFRSAATTHAAV